MQLGGGAPSGGCLAPRPSSRPLAPSPCPTPAHALALSPSPTPAPAARPPSQIPLVRVLRNNWLGLALHVLFMAWISGAFYCGVTWLPAELHKAGMAPLMTQVGRARGGRAAGGGASAGRGRRVAAAAVPRTWLLRGVASPPRLHSLPTWVHPLAPLPFVASPAGHPGGLPLLQRRRPAGGGPRL